MYIRNIGGQSGDAPANQPMVACVDDEFSTLAVKICLSWCAECTRAGLRNDRGFQATDGVQSSAPRRPGSPGAACGPGHEEAGGS
jgi:hypothetical protein